MPHAHLYIFSDGCPTDWLGQGGETWHTIVNFVFQSDPKLQQQIDNGKAHYEVLAQDAKFSHFITDLRVQLPSNQLNKWKTGPGYRASFCRTFSTILPYHKPLISAYSFQEKTLRASKEALLEAYNHHIGGIEGRGIGFEEYQDSKGRLQMKHSFVNFYGYHEIRGLENQMLVLLLMSWLIADQYVFYCKNIVGSQQYGFDQLAITVVSDKLSGDDDLRRKSEQNLRNLIDPEGENIPIVLTRSPESDTYPGDLLVDNIAGWLNAAITEPSGEFSRYVKNVAIPEVWNGWRLLLPSISKLEAIPAISKLIAS